MTVPVISSEILIRYLQAPGQNPFSIPCRSAGDTQEFGRALGALLKPGAVLALEGDLGSGKTTLIQGIVQGVGTPHPEEVKSPTFVLMHIYGSKVPVYHFDLYRLEKESEMIDIGMEEFLGSPSAICCVEWAEKGKALMPSGTFWIRIKIDADGARTIRCG